MAQFAEASLLSILLKAAATLALVVVGLRLLWSSHVDRSPKLAARRASRQKAYVSPYAKPLPAEPVSVRLAPGAELRKLTAVLDRARDQVQSVNQATLSASRQIDGAEVALNRLLQEIAGVMPQAIALTIVPRRPLSPAAAERSAAALAA